jgi:gamma-glutamylcyclotransferase (GGCT)/AIG2-like uncharacterized protein YtfP
MNKEYLFVYGMFRDSAKNLLGEVIKCGKANVPGKLYLVNEFYPGFVSGKKGITWGDVYLVDSDIFDNLDEFEGDEYIRKKIRTSTDLECWIYEYKHDISKFKEIKGGDWILRHK